MILENIFPTPIWQDQLNCDLYLIKQYILSEKKRSEGRKLSNVNGWQSDDYYPNVLMDTPICQFITILEKKLKLCFQDYGVSTSPVISNLWFNVNTAGSYNLSHVHTSCFLSGVFYIFAKNNSGDIVFERDASSQYILGSHARDSTNFISTTHWKYKPKPNMLLIFPAWVPHSVEINKSQEDRISISFNILQS